MAPGTNGGDPFSYLLNRLEPSGDGGTLVSSSSVPAGSPLLAVPLASCWTADRAKKCKALAQALTTASNRNPRLELLKSDTTWIALHLAYEKKRGDKAPVQCREHLASLPEASETLAAWSTADLAALQGSYWRKEVVRRRAGVEADFDALLEELGPPDVAALGIDEQGYAWARQLLLEFGVQVLAYDGRPMTLLVPGLERLRPDDSTVPGADTLRLEFGQSGEKPVLVLSSSRSYAKGEQVGLAHPALACCNGRRLLACGWPLQQNPWNYVEVCLEMVHDERTDAALGDLAAALEWHDGFPPSAPGDCLSADAIDGWMPVSAVVGGAPGRVQVRLRLTRAEPLPGGKTLAALLGTALLGDPEALPRIMKAEKDLPDVLGQDACERRGLLCLKEKLVAMFKEFPTELASGAQRLPAGNATRAQRAAFVAAGEREIIAAALQQIERRLSSPLPHEPCAALRGLGPLAPEPDLSTGQEPDPKSHVGEALTKLRGCSQQLGELASRFASLRDSGKLALQDGQGLQSELQVLRGCLRGSRLGDPGAADAAPTRPSADPLLRAHGEATAALLEAVCAGQEWEIASLEREAAGLAPCDEPGKDDPRRLLSEILVARAGVQIRRSDFDAAHADLKRSLKYSPKSAATKAMARDCAATSVARSQRVLAEESWKGTDAALKTFRSRLEALGYLRLGPPLPPRAAAPLHAVLEEMWTEDLQKRMLDAAGEDWRSGGLTDAVRLLLLRRPLPLRRAVELFSKEAVALLLARSAFSCYRLDEAMLLEPKKAAKLAEASAGKDAEGVEVFSNVALWPLQQAGGGGGVLVAADFDPSPRLRGPTAGEPVPYPAEDTGALIAGTRERQSAESVLHVCCGCGAEGLVALQSYARKVTFLDSNPRALAFVHFAARLNGFADRATFLMGSPVDSRGISGLKPPFDAVLLCSRFLPNPDSIASNLGPAYLDGGKHGEVMLQAVVGQCARRLLAPGGWLLATALAPNAEGLAGRVAAWADGVEDGHAGQPKPADFRAALLCGAPRPAADVLLGALQDAPQLEQQRYLSKLLQEDVHTVSEAILTLTVCPDEVATRKDLRVEMRFGSGCLWSDASWSSTEAQRVLEGLLASLSVARLVAQGPGQSPLYSLSWQAESAADARNLAIEEPTEVKPGTLLKSPFARFRSSRRAARLPPNVDGCSWEEVGDIQIMGFTPPMLCDVFWAETPLPEVKDQLPKQHIALLEIRGCRLPAGMEKALRRNLQATTRYTFDGKPREFQVASGGSFAGYGGPLEDTDVLVVPLLPGVYSDAPLEALATELVLLFQAVNEIIEREQRYVTVVVLTSGSSGPITDAAAAAQRLAAPAPIQGVARVARTEFPMLPIICLDTDMLGASGDARVLTFQVLCELEATDGTMEVAYRNETRYAPRVKLSCRNLIRAGCKPPSLPWAGEDGCVLITGGLGGLGVVTAEALAEAGARRFVLVSRSGQIARDGQGLLEKIQRLEQSGRSVHVMMCDTSSEKQVREMLEEVRAQHGPLHVVIHAAGVLDDKMFIRQDADSMRKSFAPKADGAWYLHQHTKQDDLKMFCCFSSIAGLIGNGGQANYAAANTYMDELCKWRAAQGLPSVSLQLPGIAEVGMAAAMDKKTALQDDYTIKLSTFKQVLKQAIAGTAPIEPVVVVTTIGMLRPLARQQASMMEMLLGTFVEKLKVEDGELVVAN